MPAAVPDVSTDQRTTYRKALHRVPRLHCGAGALRSDRRGVGRRSGGGGAGELLGNGPPPQRE